jgi:putative transposase
VPGRWFVIQGIDEGQRWDLTGGGLIRSTGGWAAIKALRKEKVHVKSDERILGDDGAFVKKFLAESQERYESRCALQANGINLDHVAARVAELLGIQSEQVWQAGKARLQVKARRVCFVSGRFASWVKA